MKKKYRGRIVLVLVLLVLFPLWSQFLWEQDFLKLFPSAPVSDGYLMSGVTGTNPSYKDISVGIFGVYLNKADNWRAHCNLVIATDNDINNSLNSSVPFFGAKTGDEIVVGNYLVRIIRVLPFSQAVYIKNFTGGEVTLEIVEIKQ